MILYLIITYLIGLGISASAEVSTGAKIVMFLISPVFVPFWAGALMGEIGNKP